MPNCCGTGVVQVTMRDCLFWNGMCKHTCGILR